MHILSIDRNKSPLQISGKVAGCVVRTLKLLRAAIYWAHRAVVFAIARLSCYLFALFLFLCAIYYHVMANEEFQI